MLAAVAVVRWNTFQSVPSGVDAGNWLAFGHAIHGMPVRSSSIVYPPLVPLLSVGAVNAFGLINGLRLLAVVSGAFPAFAVYTAVRAHAGPWWGAGGALLFGASASIGEAVAWGGYPQLLGIGFLVLFALTLDSSVSSDRWQQSIAAALCLAGALACSDLIGGAAVLTGVVVVALHLLVDRGQRAPWRTLVSRLAVIALPAVVFVPLYSTLFQTLVQSQGVNGPSFTFGVLGQSLDTTYAEWPGLWRVLYALALIAPLVFVAQRRSFLWRLVVAVDVVTLVGLLAIREFRFVYLLPLAGVLTIGLTANAIAALNRDLWRHVVHGLALALGFAVVIELVSGSSEFPTQIRYYTVLTPSMAAVMDWIRAQTPAGTVVAVSATQQDFPLGWWVEGYAERPAVYDADSTLLIYNDERRRVSQAETLFRSGTGVARARQIARSLGAVYLLVDKRWAGYAEWARSDPPRPGAPGVIVDNQSVLLVATKA